MIRPPNGGQLQGGQRMAQKPGHALLEGMVVSENRLLPWVGVRHRMRLALRGINNKEKAERSERNRTRTS